MTNSIDRVQPNAVEVERAVLGSMMLDEQAAETVLEILDETCFFKDAHKTIFLAMQRLSRGDTLIDLPTVTEALHSAGKLEGIGGAVYLADLFTDSVASPANVEHHARIVLRKSTLRKLIHACIRTIETAYTEPDDVGFIDKHEQEVYDLTVNNYTKEPKPLGEYLIRNIDQLNSVKADQTLGVTSGYKVLDELTAGWQAGDLIILAGRPSMGKTAFALALARNALTKGKVPVGFFSLEMGGDQLSLRMISAETSINSHLIRTGKIKTHETKRVIDQAYSMMDDKIYIDETAGLSVASARSKARRLCKQDGIKILFIDYLQLMNFSGRARSKNEEVAEISKAMKNLAKDLQIPIVLLSQLSRAVELRTDKKPILSDLRDSGAIEQDADVVIFLYRPCYYGLTDKQGVKYSDDHMKLIIAKQRMGPLGERIFIFDPKCGKFIAGTNRKEDQGEVPF